MRGDSRFVGFIENKGKRLLIPYVFTVILWVLPIDKLLFNPSIESIINNYVLAIGPSQLWFLWMLFDVFVIVGPLRKIVLKYPIVGWMIVLFFQHRHEDSSKGRREGKTGLGNATSISHTYSLAKKTDFSRHWLPTPCQCTYFTSKLFISLLLLWMGRLTRGLMLE